MIEKRHWISEALEPIRSPTFEMLHASDIDGLFNICAINKREFLLVDDYLYHEIKFN
jgi:hypothetical protein